MAKKIAALPEIYTMNAKDVAARGSDPFELLGKERLTANEAGTLSPVTPLGFNLDDHVGEVFKNKPVLGLDGVISHIDSGTTAKLPNAIITFSFLEKNHLVGLFNNPQIGFTADYFVSPFSGAQRAEARQSIQFWDDLIKPTFVEKNGTGADIQFINSFDPAQAYAYYPGEKGYKFQSDVFIADPRANSTNNWLGFNGYGATTLIHEIGHTIGLSHPGAYNYDPNLDLTYANYAEYAQDSTQYSIMSYWGANETGARVREWSNLQIGNPQTPMLHDILTVQSKYGADPTTRVGDTVYGFGSTAGRDVFDFSANKFPFLAIYDAGGTDTINLSGFTASQFLDLHEGSFSSIGAAIPSLGEITQARIDLSNILGFTLSTRSQGFIDNLANTAIGLNQADIKADTGVDGIAATEYMNVAIAYGTKIENAIGGSARDLLWGNELANKLEGRGGDDVINGYEGDDVLVGGAGIDTLTGGAGNDRFVFTDASNDIVTDYQAGHDKFDFSSFKGVSAAQVQIDNANDAFRVDTDHNGSFETVITVHGDDVIITDFIFG